MKRLTMNHVARANLKHNKKAYLSLAAGIFLAVYLACAAVLCIYGAMTAQDEKMAQKVGWADTLLTHTNSVTTNALRQSGLFDRIGHVYVFAQVNQANVFIGSYDEDASALLNRRCIEGRMPQKPGEIAAERSALDKLKLEEAAIGDVFTWKLQPFEAYKGRYETREFTLVGILSEQSGYFSEGASFGSQSYTDAFPSIITHPDEPNCRFGTTCVHWVMTNQPGVTLTDVQTYERANLSNSLGVSRVRGSASSVDNSGYDLSQRFLQINLYLILGCALLLTTSVSIASTMDSMLARKTEDIGMMRAVGATKRQIRRLYGRDAWLLAMTALPIGTAFGCLTVWLFSVISPDDMRFCPEPVLLVPILLISLLCIFASSSIPLRRASRQLPMGVLRDTAFLRKAKHFRIRKNFKGLTMIARRRFSLHPMRHAGGAFVAGLMLLCAILLGEMLLNSKLNFSGSIGAFSLDAGYDLSVRTEPFAQIANEDRGLKQNDENQIRVLPMVRNLNTLTKTNVLMLLPDELPLYLKTEEIERPQKYDNLTKSSYASISGKETFYLSLSENASADDFIDEYYYEYAVRTKRLMKLCQQSLGIDAPVLPVNMYVISVDDIDLSQCTYAGEIDFEALDTGREVILYAPNKAVLMRDDGWNTWTNNLSDPRAERVFINDYFVPGMTLNLAQLFGEQAEGLYYNSDDDAFLNFYNGLDKVFASVKVGAVLDGYIRLVQTVPGELCIITTSKGANALGIMTNDIEKADVYLTSDPNRETETALENRIARIGMRRNMTLTNNLEQRREQKAYETRIMLLFGGMAILFFSVAVSMQVTNIARSIRSDERMIGTLRAVGADERALIACFRLPAFMSVTFGYALAVIVYLLMYFLYPIGFARYHIWLLGLGLILAALVLLSVMAGVRGQLRKVVGKSIVENIREL